MTDYSSCDGLGVDTYLGVFIGKVVEEGGEEFVHAVNSVTVFTQNPDHGGSGERRGRLISHTEREEEGREEGGREGARGRR